MKLLKNKQIYKSNYNKIMNQINNNENYKNFSHLIQKNHF